jgi:hypothetical protein
MKLTVAFIKNWMKMLRVYRRKLAFCELEIMWSKQSLPQEKAEQLKQSAWNLHEQLGIFHQAWTSLPDQSREALAVWCFEKAADADQKILCQARKEIFAVFKGMFLSGEIVLRESRDGLPMILCSSPKQVGSLEICKAGTVSFKIREKKTRKIG